MNYYAKHARAVAATQTRLAQDCPLISWRNNEWAIIPGTVMRRADLTEGGYQLNADLKFEALVSTFANGGDIKCARDLKGMLLQSPIGYLGDSYKVISVGIRPGGLSVSVECNALDQNA